MTERLTLFERTIRGVHEVRDQLIAHTDLLGGVAPLASFFPAIERLINFGFELVDVCSRAGGLSPVEAVPLQNPLAMDFAIFKQQATSLTT